MVAGVDVADLLGAQSGRHGAAPYTRAPCRCLCTCSATSPTGVPPLALTGERTLPDVPEENYWYRRHLTVYELDRGARRGPAGDRHGLRGGLRLGRARGQRRERGGRGRQPGGARARAPALPPGEPALRARPDRDLLRGGGRGGVPADDRASPAIPGRRSSTSAGSSGSRAGGRGTVYLSTPNVLTLAPKGAERSDNPWHVHEYRAAEFERLCREHFASVRLFGLFHARKLRVHELALRAGLGSGAPPAGLDGALLRAVHPRDLRRGLRAARARPSRPGSGAGLRGGVPGVSRARGELAIVLHTHMPYVEGFGTWPFGEEWLWEAMASCYLPLLDLLDAGGAADALADPGAVRPAGGPGRGGALRAVRGRGPARHPRRGRPRAARRWPRARSRASWSAPGATTSARWRASSAARRRPAGRARRPTPSGPPRPRTRCCRCWPPRPGCARRCRPASTSHRARFGAGLARGLLAAGVRLRAVRSSRALADAGVRAVCVELTSRFGLGAPRAPAPAASASPGVVLVPIDRATISLVWSDAGYPAHGALPRLPPPHRSTTTTRGPTTAAPTTTGARWRSRASTPPTSWRAPASGCAATARACPAAVWSVCALDTELLGHWWYEGVAWLTAVVEECARQGLELVRLDDALERHEPRWRAAEELRGEPGQASTWGARAATSRHGPAPRWRTSPSRRAPRSWRWCAPAPARVTAARARAAGAAGERLGLHGLPRPRRALRARALRGPPPQRWSGRWPRARTPTRALCATSPSHADRAALLAP